MTPRKLKRPICLLRGHIIDLQAQEHGFPCDCERCDKQDCDPHSTFGALDHLAFWWRYNRPNWMRPIHFFKRCPDCGKRFNRHTDKCIPF